jgi:thiol-disulfide isomerase/thioredoxin
MKREFWGIAVVAVCASTVGLYSFYTHDISAHSDASNLNGLALDAIHFSPNLPPMTLIDTEVTCYVFAKGTVEKKTIKMADLKGQTAVLHFWVTWCGPCRQELPSFAAFMKEHKTPHLAIINEDVSPQAIQTFLEEHKIDALTVVIDSSRVLNRQLGVQTLPTTVFIDSQNRDRGRVLGPIMWEDKSVARLIKQSLLGKVH